MFALKSHPQKSLNIATYHSAGSSRNGDARATTPILIFVLAIVTFATQGLDGHFAHSEPDRHAQYLVSTT